VAIWVRVRMNPELAPMETTTYSLREKVLSLRMAGPLVLIIAAIVSGLYLGIFTPTEAGGIGAMLTLILGCHQRCRRLPDRA